MKKCLLIIGLLSSFQTLAASQLSADLAIDKLIFQKPPKGIGKAGILIFKNANVNNNGIILNINNTNNYFDSQIFVRPTFLGFTTQFGNYGFTLDEGSIVNSVNYTEIQNSKLILDDNQLNLSGETFKFTNPDSNVTLNKFRLYCQQASAGINAEKTSPKENSDMIKNCYSFLTLNGSYSPGNELASLELENIDKKTSDKTHILTKIRSIDLRKTQISANLVGLKTISNNSYSINADIVNFLCAKDADLKEMDVEKIKKSCLNDFKLAPLKATLIDKTTNASFNIDLKDITIKNKIAYFAVNNMSLSDPLSTTYIKNLLLNCKKETETDLMDLNQVLVDCISYSRISLAEVQSSKPDDKKNSSIKNIIINSTNSSMMIHAETKFLGLTAKVTIYAKVLLDQAQKKLSLTVTDTKLPLGITSVKLLMYFLKKTIISKNVAITNNVITISL